MSACRGVSPIALRSARGSRRIRDYLLKFVACSVSHYQTIIEGLLERNIGIEKYFSYVIIKSPFVKRHYPLEALFADRH
ncbi:asnC family protein [Burkholderia oklahomensis]|uniref:AsnC family protein n=1 Tax=Burkholderia oklahomensis TaxID=342113 RepID=A0AAI8BEP9_9BURK|nr:asnC family protein [Burkholderia oklahomensis]